MKQLVFLLLLVGTALADDHTSVQAHDLYKYCKESLRMSNGDMNVNFGDAGYCSGYLRGLADGMTLWGYSEGTFKITNVSSETLVRSFVNYVNAHPAEMDASDVIVILTKAWKADHIFIATPKPVKQ